MKIYYVWCTINENFNNPFSEEINTSLHFYPNPVIDELNIELPESDIRNITLEIFATNGSLVQSSACPVMENIATPRGLSGLPANVYLVVYHVDRRKYVLKFVKK